MESVGWAYQTTPSGALQPQPPDSRRTIFPQIFSCFADSNIYGVVSRAMSGNREKHLCVLFLSPDFSGVQER